MIIISHNAYSFIFNGKSCYEFGLMIYNIGNESQGESILTSPVEIQEDRINKRYDPLFYGSVQNKPLEFNLVMGLSPDLINKGHKLDRWDISNISSWLCTGSYKWLEIEQDDMNTVRYKCIISNLKIIDIGWQPIGISVSVRCDSPFAYTYPLTYSYTTVSSQNVFIYSQACNEGTYKPKIKITLPSGVTSISIKNITNNNKIMTFSGFTNSSGLIIDIDNLNEIITTNTGMNMYQYFNFNFFELVKGDNQILITGHSTIDFICEFPINVGG